jgi:hypothetical protein
MTNNRVCQKCGAASAVVNLATADNAAPDAPDHWLCIVCFGAGVNEASVMQQVEEDAAEHHDQGGRLN